MTDFWFNHFNVFVGKGPERAVPHQLRAGRDPSARARQVRRPAGGDRQESGDAVLSRQLDERGPELRCRRSAFPHRPIDHTALTDVRAAFRSQNPNAKRKQNSGLNENYGRELLELHTLSVNGGYSQRDVTEVAKVFTGWTIEKPYEGGGFKYDPRMHEPGPKFVLGHHIKPKGEDEGREVLHMLATSPQTAHFISLKLAQRFVSDDPPPALVDRMAKTFEKKKGDIREVLSTLFHSPEFWADSAYRAKVKTPLEFVASAVRATGADVDDAMPLARQLGNMGMPLYGAQPPTGYSMKAETWVSSSALLNRMNFALGLTGGQSPRREGGCRAVGRRPAAAAQTRRSRSLLLEAKLLGGDVSKQTHDSIIAQIAGSGEGTARERARQPEIRKRKPADVASPDASTIAGLLLGSPEFQREMSFWLLALSRSSFSKQSAKGIVDCRVRAES